MWFLLCWSIIAAASYREIKQSQRSIYVATAVEPEIGGALDVPNRNQMASIDPKVMIGTVPNSLKQVQQLQTEESIRYVINLLTTSERNEVTHWYATAGMHELQLPITPRTNISESYLLTALEFIKDMAPKGKIYIHAAEAMDRRMIGVALSRIVFVAATDNRLPKIPVEAHIGPSLDRIFHHSSYSSKQIAQLPEAFQQPAVADYVDICEAIAAAHFQKEIDI